MREEFFLQEQAEVTGSKAEGDFSFFSELPYTYI